MKKGFTKPSIIERQTKRIASLWIMKNNFVWKTLPVARQSLQRAEDELKEISSLRTELEKEREERQKLQARLKLLKSEAQMQANTRLALEGQLKKVNEERDCVDSEAQQLYWQVQKLQQELQEKEVKSAKTERARSVLERQLQVERKARQHAELQLQDEVQRLAQDLKKEKQMRAQGESVYRSMEWKDFNQWASQVQQLKPAPTAYQPWGPGGPIPPALSKTERESRNRRFEGIQTVRRKY